MGSWVKQVPSSRIISIFRLRSGQKASNLRRLIILFEILRFTSNTILRLSLNPIHGYLRGRIRKAK